MERTFTSQLSGPTTVTAWRPKSASHHRQDNAFFRSVLPDSSGLVACCGWRDGQQFRLGFQVLSQSSWIPERQVRNLELVPCISNVGKYERSANERRRPACSVLSEVVGQSSGSQVPPGRAAASPGELKDQLEALQDEALQVRNRFNNAKARFMRLTEVAQQLRQRATIDLNLGNEDGARNALIEKQKVLQAAEISKKRAQLLEELSTKLCEAISVKETHLIVALSSPPREEPTVRVVSSKLEPASSVELDLNKEENLPGLGTAEASQNGQEVSDLEEPAAVTEDLEGYSRQVGRDSGDVLIEKEEASLAAELGYSTGTHLYGNDEDVEATSPKFDSKSTIVPLGGDESEKYKSDIKSRGSLSLKDSAGEALLASGPSGNSQDSVSDIGIPNANSRISDVDDIFSLKSGSAGNEEVGGPSINFRPESPKQQQQEEQFSANNAQRRGGVVKCSSNAQRESRIVAGAAAKRRPKQNSRKIAAEKLAASLGLTKSDQENGVLDLLDLGGLNGNWLSKDDDFDDLDEARFLDAVVKVYCTRSEPNFSLPWQKMRQYSVTGSGFMISNRRLLTNAHCVEHHTQVKVKRRGNDTKFVATVLAVGRECDIALLSVEDDEFWQGVEPLEFGKLPRLQDPVTVVGYPIGGETISVTSGVVSRVEITSYAHGATELLAVQIDAAINPGNSGGPAFDDDGECVGIAFQSIDASDAENIGYVIPTPVIMHFLYDYERNGKNTGFPSSGIVWQRLENSALRAALKMTSTQKGVLIRRVEPTAPSAQVLKVGDVLMKFDGVSVANEGTVPFQAGERIAFTFLASQKYSGDVVEVEILRDGQVMTLQTALKSPIRLVPVHIDGRQPSYLIVAGLVFTVVSQPFLESHFGMDDYGANIPVKILEKATYGMAQTEDEQLVVVSQVLASDVNIGYEDIEATQVLTFNGTKIRNLKQLVQLADSCAERYIQIELDNQMLVVIDTEQARAGIPQILRDHCIPADRSEDLL